MPSAKKIEPSPKTKTAPQKTNSSKRRVSKTSGSKIVKSKDSREVKTKEVASKEKARTSLALKHGSIPKTAGKAAAQKSSAAASKKTASAASRTRKSQATAAAKSAASKGGAKSGASAKVTQSRSKVGKIAPAKAGRTAARAHKTATAVHAKQADRKLSTQKTAVRGKRVEKVAALPQASKKKTASRSRASAKTVKFEGVAAVHNEVATPHKLNVVSETVVALPIEKISTTGAGEPRVLMKEPVKITLETSDHQPVTQKIQKKTAATSAPIADTAAADASAVTQMPMKADMAKPAAERPVESKIGEANGAVLPAAEAKLDKTVAATAKPAKAPSGKPGFKTTEFIVYPAHGVGQVIAIEEQEVAGFKLELYVISFVKDKMILKVPTPKAASVGMRKLGSADVVKRALGTLTGRARVKRTMWSRRAQEYEAKINSGDLVAIAEVVRDLYRSEAQPEQSYSERQLYEAALDRVAREISVVQKLTETESLRLIEAQLQKGPRRGKAEDADVVDADADEGDIDEAA
jgi:CarD family transcriptional regulator